MAAAKSIKLKHGNVVAINTDRQQQECRRWEEAEKSWRITPREAAQRVLALRHELECYRDQLDGAAFDIASGDACSPDSLDGSQRRHTLELVESLNPLVDKYFDMIDAYAKEHGTHEDLDFNAKLFELKMDAAETGFQIGVLAGVILAGCPKETIDRFERGLTVAVQSNRRMIKA